MIKVITLVLISLISTLGVESNMIESAKQVEDKQIIIEEDGQKYSSNTIIVSVDSSATKEEMYKFFEESNLEIVYEYKNFNMFALKTTENLTKNELEKLIEELEKDKRILGVEKDYIVSID